MAAKVLVIYYLVATWFIEGGRTFDLESSITGLYTGPYFDPLTNRNLSAHLGERAKLPCTVRQLGDKSVSWVRMRDADILTVDRYTFVGDERFEAHYSELRESWTLVIKFVQKRDAGLYECQVSTEPKMSQLFSLRVVVPKVSMVPPVDRYVKEGSRVQINCRINNVVMIPDYIFWYHNNIRIMDNKNPNILVTVKRTGAESITSTLIMFEVHPEASGNYTCMPSNLESVSIVLHVIKEKKPEAMQGERNSSPIESSGCHLYPQLYLILLLLLLVSCCSFPSCQEANEANMKKIIGHNRFLQCLDQTHSNTLEADTPSMSEDLFIYASTSSLFPPLQYPNYSFNISFDPFPLSLPSNPFVQYLSSLSAKNISTSFILKHSFVPVLSRIEHPSVKLAFSLSDYFHFLFMSTLLSSSSPSPSSSSPSSSSSSSSSYPSKPLFTKPFDICLSSLPSCFIQKRLITSKTILAMYPIPDDFTQVSLQHY